MQDDINGVRLWWRQAGSGDTVVLLPGGFGLASDYLDPLVRMLESSYRVTQYDPRGCGRSASIGPFDLATSLRDLDALRAHAGIARWVLIGHSAGASMALAYALEYGEAAMGVVCISGGSGLHDDRQWHDIYESGMEAGLDPVPETRFPFNMAANRELNASWRRYIKQPNLLRRVSRLPTPVLLIHGARDIRPSWPMEQIAELVPQGEFQVVQEASHIPWATHAQAVRRLLLQFLRTLTA